MEAWTKKQRRWLRMQAQMLSSRDPRFRRQYRRDLGHEPARHQHRSPGANPHLTNVLTEDLT